MLMNRLKWLTRQTHYYVFRITLSSLSNGKKIIYKSKIVELRFNDIIINLDDCDSDVSNIHSNFQLFIFILKANLNILVLNSFIKILK